MALVLISHSPETSLSPLALAMGSLHCTIMALWVFFFLNPSFDKGFPNFIQLEKTLRITEYSTVSCTLEINVTGVPSQDYKNKAKPKNLVSVVSKTSSPSSNELK